MAAGSPPQSAIITSAVACRPAAQCDLSRQFDLSEGTQAKKVWRQWAVSLPTPLALTIELKLPIGHELKSRDREIQSLSTCRQALASSPL